MPLLATRGASSNRAFGFAGKVIPKPINTVAPVVSGSTSAGSTLSVTTGTWTSDTPITYTYQWQRNGANISGATNSTFTTDFADINRVIRCRVTATNDGGSITATSNQTASISSPAIGNTIGGGYYAGVVSYSNNSVATHHIIVAPRSPGQIYGQLHPDASVNANSRSVIDGFANTNNMASGAKEYFRGLTIGGYTDWYIPSRWESDQTYFVFKPGTNSPYIGGDSGQIGGYAVPYRSFTSPSQTSVLIFRDGSSQNYAVNQYWTSTCFPPGDFDNYNYIQQYTGGRNNSGDRNNGNRFIRAIRRVPV